jgi:hypothetical protein
VALSYLDAYSQIKTLEANGTLNLPATSQTVEVGTIDAQTGDFTWSVPTIQQTYTHPVIQTGVPGPVPGPVGGAGSGLGPGGGIGPGGGGGTGGGGKPDPPLVITCGIVTTSAVHLYLSFTVTNVPPLQNQVARVRVGDVAGEAGGVLLGSNGGVSISGFPTVPAYGSRVVLDADLAASAPEQTIYVDPPMSVFPLGITLKNGAFQYVHIMIVRPPVLGFGAFTIPALPIALICAPPPGALKKNSNTFNDRMTVTRSVTSAFTSNTATKVAQAYSMADVLAKVAQIAAAAAAITAVGASGGSVGIFAAIAAFLVGKQDEGNPNEISDSVKGVGNAAQVLGGVLGGVGDQGVGSQTTTVSVENDHTMAFAMTTSDTYGSEAGSGPGTGDRFVYLSNVRAVWMALNGDVGIHVLGYDGVAAYSADALKTDRQSLTNGEPAHITGLDADALDLLLRLDPFCVPLPRRVSPFQPPVIGPPRFVPADPQQRKGSGTPPAGDVFSVANETIVEDKTVTNNITTKVTDAKPGWLDVVFGADDTETTTTMTFTSGATTDDKSDETITNTITMFSQGSEDAYDLQIYYDRLFGTLVPVPTGSPLLQGGLHVVLGPPLVTTR